MNIFYALLVLLAAVLVTTITSLYALLVLLDAVLVTTVTSLYDRKYIVIQFLY